MRFILHSENDVGWMRDPDGYEAGDTIRRIKDAGKWDEFLTIHQDEEGNVDCDSLYDYLRHESGSALLDVGLHDNEGTATVNDVIAAWAEKNREKGFKLSYCEDGVTVSGVMLFKYGNGQTDLEFDAVNPDGEVEGIDLEPDEVLDLVGSRANGNATEGAWDCTDDAVAEFEMWRGRE